MTACDPYCDVTFFSFFPLFFSRLFSFFTGHLPLQSLAADEVQFFTLAFVGVMGAFLGTFLILKKMAMLANALSHTSLLGIVLVYFIAVHFFSFETNHAFPLSLLFLTAILTGLLTTFLTQFFHRTSFLPEEASTGLVFTSLFALGIFLLSLFGKNLHLGTELIIGNADALKLDDMILVFRSLLITGSILFLFYKEMKITSFDPLLAKVLGVRPALYNYLLMLLTSIALIASFRAVGVLMGLGFFIAPPLIARKMTDRLLVMIALSSLISVGASLFGVALSRHLLSYYALSLSTAGLIVSLLFFSYLASIFIPKKSCSD